MTNPLLPRFLFWAFALAGPLSLHAERMTLSDATRLMLRFEPELNAAEYDTLSAREDIEINRAEMRPHVSMNGSAGLSNRDRTADGLVRTGDTLFQRQLGVSVRQLLYDGGIAKNATRASENAFLAQQYHEKSMIEDRVVDLVEVYLEVMRTAEQLRLAESNVQAHRDLLAKLERKAENFGNRTEVALVNGRLGRAVNSLQAKKLTHELAVSRFARLTGQQPGDLVYPDPPPFCDRIDDVDLKRNWAYLSASEALEAAEHRANATRAKYRPKVYFDAGYTAGRDVIGIDGQDDEARALIVASWDLYSGGRKKAEDRRDKLQVGKYEELKRAANLQRVYRLNVLWQEREAAGTAISTMGNYADELAAVVSDYERLFSLGKEDLINILDVRSEHYSAQSELIDSRYDLDTGQFRIMGHQGILAEWILGPDGNSRSGGGSGKEPLPAADVQFSRVEPAAEERVPLTQVELMERRFDREGPTAEFLDSPMEENYGLETNSRKGALQRWFGRSRDTDSSAAPADVRPKTRSTRRSFHKRR